MLMTRPRLISPTPVAAIALAILAFMAPCSRAHARTPPPDLDDEVLLDERPPSETTGETTSATPRTPVSWTEPVLVMKSRWSMLRWFAAAGVRFGSFTINGDSSGTAIPFHLDLGVRRDRWLAFASYDVFGVTARVPALAPGGADTARASELPPLGDGSGLAHRLGIAARYTLTRFGESDGGLEIWAEGGLGVEHLRWDAGGTLTRPDLALGIGATFIYLGRSRHSGITTGLRITIAPRNDVSNAPPACGGPCDTATPPSSLDRSFLFDITVPFGT